MPDIELFKTMAEFAKAGWKPSDVKEMLEELNKAPKDNEEGGSGLDPDPSDNKDEQPKDNDPIAAIIDRENNK